MDDRMEIACQSVRKYAHVIGQVPLDAELFEVCDFGDSIGFIFKTEDIYSNLYWCVDKKTYKITTFGPNMDMRKYSNRKILDKSSFN